MRTSRLSLVAALSALLTILAGHGVAASSAVGVNREASGQAISYDEDAKTVSMCGDRYCAVFDGAGRAVLSNLTVDGQELLDPSLGVHSSITTAEGDVTSLELATDPRVQIDDDEVVVRFTTSVADEKWTFDVDDDRLRFTLTRTYRADLTMAEQGSPRMVFAEDAVDQMRWPDDGGNFPVGGRLVDTYQTSWLAGGARFDPGVRTSKEQVSYDLLDADATTALRIRGSTSNDAIDRGRASEVWRSQEQSGKSLNVAVLTSRDGPRYRPSRPLGYAAQTTQDGSPVFQPVSVERGSTEAVSLTFAPADYDAYYDLGRLNGVDEDVLSAAINDYARWMMQDVDKGASTEQPQLQSEMPPFEMHWIIQLLELFPEPGALRSLEHGFEDIRDYLQQDSGRVFCCHPGLGESFGRDYGDHVSGYALGVARLYQLTGRDRWLASMANSVNRALDYLVTSWTDPATHFVRNVDPELGEPDYNNDYFESSTGTFNGYTTVLLYDALAAWSNLERDVLGDRDRAAELDSLAATIKSHFNKDVDAGGFWSPRTHTFLYGSGNQDVRYLPVNAAVLKTDIVGRERARQIVESIEEQNAAGNYDLHPMNVGDLFTRGAAAPTAGKGGENGGWYGAPDGDYYAGLPLLEDPQVMQTAIASFLTRYQADGFYGATTWDRDAPTSRTGGGVWFPTTVMPAWGLYHYGYGFQPANDRLVLAPYITDEMSGSRVDYRWRGTPLSVTYESQTAFVIKSKQGLSTPLTIRWINQRPGHAYRVSVSGRPDRMVVADREGTVEVTLAGQEARAVRASCDTCRVPGVADPSDGQAVDSYSAAGAEARSDQYEQVGMQVAVGPRPITVTSVGRFKLDGNTDVHRVKILDVDGRIVASAPVDTERDADAAGFVTAALSEPVTLQPGIYYVVSSETPSGDAWYDAGGDVVAGENVTVLGAARGRARTVPVAGATAYGPVTFGYDATGESTPWIQALVDPTSLRASSGDEVTVNVTVWGQADDPIDGTVTADLPAGWTAEPQEFTIPTDGDVASTTVSMTVRVASDAATDSFTIPVTASADTGLRSSRSFEVAIANLVYDFDDGTTQDWRGVPPVAELSAVTGIANGPGVPHGGSHVLEVGTGTVDGPNDPRTIFVEPSEPLDLSNASTFYAYVDSWGIPPYTQTHRVEITLHSGSGSVSATSEFSANVWNRAAVDISSWSGRSNITRIDVTYTLNVSGSTSAFVDLDSVGWDA
jgi:hypothetical protein